MFVVKSCLYRDAREKLFAMHGRKFDLVWEKQVPSTETLSISN